MPNQRKGKSVLVIRFNSIGDIILTSPVAECLSANGYNVHYLVKHAFKELLEANPFIDKVWLLRDDLKEITTQLQAVDFELVVDLHNNFRSKHISKAIGVRTLTLQKERVGLFLLTQWGIGKRDRTHIVNRFLNVLQPLGLRIENYAPQVFIDNAVHNDEFPEKYIAIAIGTAWKTKTIPEEMLVKILEAISDIPILLIGGPEEKLQGDNLAANRPHVRNLSGQLTINQSANVVQGAQVLLTGDTGMMHMAAAMDVSVVAIFGSTHPMLGYSPFYRNKTKHSLIQNKELSCRPCTKQGKNACPKGHFKCMMDLDAQEIIDELLSYVD